MKKRLLSALLALALVFVLLPTAALADTPPETDDNVKINGTPVTVGNDISLGEGNGTYSYDNATHTLTLKNATINATDSNIGISFGVPVKGNIDYKIELVGNNSITSTSAQAIYVEHDTSVEAWEKDTMRRSTLTINGSAGSQLILNASGYEKEAIWSKGDFTLSGGTAVTAFSSGKIAVNVGSMAINNSKLSAQSSSYGTTVVLYGFEMIGDAAEFEALNTSSGVRAVLRTSGASENIDWSKYQLITGSYSGNALTKSEPTVCDKNTLNELFSSSSTTRYIHIAKRTIPALTKTPDVLIAGEKAVVGQLTTITADSCSGSYYYDAAKKELTLKDVNITRNNNNVNHAIQFTKNGDYTINLEGANNISSVTDGICALTNAFYDNPANISVTITGTGSLNVIANTYAIDMQVGNLIFNNTGNITLATNTNYTVQKTVCNALHVAGSITIDNTKYDIVGARQEKNYPTETISDSSAFTPDLLNGYTVGEETTLFKTITITPAAAKPSTIRYNGTTLKQGEIITGENGGTATVATNGNTITLNNFKGTKALSFEATLADSTLVLEGTNTLSSIVTTQKGLTISGSGSLTVGSIKVHNQKTSSDDKPNLTITDGAAVIAKSNATRAIDIDGDLTVTNGSLTATSTSNNVPTVQVGGNATFTGSTVTITNNSTTQGEQYKDSNAASSALHVNGAVTISGGTVMAEAKAGGDAIRAVGNITVSNDATVTAKNNSQYFSAITAGRATSGVVNTLYYLIVSGEKTRITATNTHDNNLTYGGAINAYIKNANEGHYLQVGTDTKAIAPNVNTTVKNNSLTITRGDEVTPVVIAGTPLLNDTYYTITNGSTVVANGSESNYNAFYDSANKTLKLNNAQISHSFAYEDGGGKDGAIIFTKFENYFIELSGENTISSTNTYAINCHRPDRTLTIKNAAEAENAKLTLTSNWMVICSIGGLNIQSDVTMVNTKRADYLMYVNGTFSYTGYNAYASTEASGSPLEVYNPENYSTYKYLRVTKENLAPTTPTTYTVTITAGDNMKRESGALTQEVTKGAAITEVKFMAASGHYFPADYVSKMNLPAGLTAEIKENSWYLIISGTPTSDVTINLPAASVRPTITVSMPTPVAGYTPATASDITLTYSDINKSISKNLTISNVVWQSYVSNGDGSITPGNTLSSGDKFEAGKTYFVRITHEYVAGKYDIVPAAGITLDYTESDSTDMMLLFYTTGAPCNHEYTNDWHANGNTHWHECKLCRAHADEVAHTFGDWITDTPATDTTDGSKHRTCSVCQYQEKATIPKTGTGEIVPPTPDNPGTIVIIRPAEEEKPAQQPNPSTGANDLVGLAVAAAVAAALGSAALLRKHD